MSAGPLPRSWLFVPADSERKLARALDAGADALILDLEDAVVPGRKLLARQMAAAFLRAAVGSTGPSLWVRVNPLSSGLMHDDLRAVLPAVPAGIVLPKPDSIADVGNWTGYRRARGRLPGARDAHRGHCHRVGAGRRDAVRHVARRSGCSLTWGAEDLAADLGPGNRERMAGWLHLPAGSQPCRSRRPRGRPSKRCRWISGRGCLARIAARAARQRRHARHPAKCRSSPSPDGGAGRAGAACWPPSPRPDAGAVQLTTGWTSRLAADERLLSARGERPRPGWTAVRGVCP
jgi:hypothetical protein